MILGWAEGLRHQGVCGRDLLEVVATASKDSVTYDAAIFGGELGPDTAVAC